MLQQTTVGAVIPYYLKWVRRFPGLEALARAPLRKVLVAWQGLGYYQRAKNLHKAARIIFRDHGGRIPENYETLRTLPGFGPYTAAAVMSLAFGRPYPVIDANVRRILMRIEGIRGRAEAKHDPRLRERLLEYFPGRNPGTFNQAMMELGALLCRSRHPLCLQCPVLEFCTAARDGLQEIIPSPRRRPAEKIEAVVAVIRSGDRFLIQKRPSGGLLAGLWEFPGGKRKPGEDLRKALRREVREETGAEIENIRFLMTAQHAYTRFRVTLHVFSCGLAGEPGPDKRTRRWVTLRAFRRYPLPSGSVKIVRFLEGQGITDDGGLPD